MDESHYYPYYTSKNLLPLGSLPSDDCDGAVKTIRMLLESPRAQYILSRIIAGPELDLAEWQNELKEPPRAPEESVSQYLEDLRNSVVETFPIDSKTLQEYQSAGREGPYRTYRLLEIVCTAIHLVSKRLYQKYHPRTPYEGFGFPLWPKILHPKYFKYPTGLDAVGFWAEALIFGGVVLFDRGASGEECNSVWLHGKPNIDTNEVYELPDTIVLTMLERGSSLPLELDWEALPHQSLAEAQQNGIFRELNLAGARGYHNFIGGCYRVPPERAAMLIRQMEEFSAKMAEEDQDQ
ncbi:hypothetical protein TWF481_005000 [Arthrobotrys musiformis]|uniref:Uncharacterized protein n=1 Tax=Arthrobotrys musiformis TaxID=47236 RepID=A0AAV9WRW7_9PEZI